MRDRACEPSPQPRPRREDCCQGGFRPTEDQSELKATDRPVPERTRRYDSPRRKKINLAIASHPTLRQAWSGECPGPQCAFKMSMFNVSCNSH